MRLADDSSCPCVDHVACFNQSGGQMCLNNARDGPNRAVMTFSANRVIDGKITGGEGDGGQVRDTCTHSTHKDTSHPL